MGTLHVPVKFAKPKEPVMNFANAALMKVKKPTADPETNLDKWVVGWCNGVVPCVWLV